jgi:CPA2 family monovalent cation:H+ antiporter-2
VACRLTPYTYWQAMDSLALTLVIVFGGVVLLPPLARRTGLPIIVAEILFGIIIGRSLFNLVPESPIVDFFSTFGLVYLMFLAGLETDLSKMRWKNVRKALAIGLVSVAVPFAAGYFIAPWVGINRLLLGTILCTTSLGLVLPILRELNLPPRLSRLLLASVILVDILSLFLLAFVLATIQGQLEARLFYSLLGIVFLFFVPWIINRRRLRRKITAKLFRKGYFEMEMRVSFALIFLLGAVSLQLGFHSIIGAFIAGLLISEILPRATLESEKLQSFGYGFFVPLFFIFTGAKVNLLAVFSSLDNVTVLLVIIAVGMLAKIVSVAAASRFSGINMRRSLAFGLFHTAMLSLILAMADISIRLGLIGERLFSIFVILALVTSTLAPALGKYILGKKAAKAK